MSQVATRKYLNPSKDSIELPGLVELQQNSYKQFLREGIGEVLEEVSPIEDFTGKNYHLKFLDYVIEEPKISESVARDRKSTYEAAIRLEVELTNKRTKQKKKQKIFLGDMPMMTSRGTFIINGVEKVVVSQLVRSPGVFFSKEKTGYFSAKVIPARGAWLEFNISSSGVVTVKIDNKRKINLGTFLRAMGFATNQEIQKTLKVNGINKSDIDFVEQTLNRDTTKTTDQALIEIYRKVRPGDLATLDNAKTVLEDLFFDSKRYDFSKVGRYKFNRTLGLDPNYGDQTLSQEDIILVIRKILESSYLDAPAQDIDHLANRRLKMVGELVQKAFRSGALRTERIVKERMSVADSDTIAPVNLINVRPITASVREFFNKSQLSQLMQQENLLSEVSHKRRLNALGPGGLTKERAGFEVRDVHRTHYGRICPVETPEGPNVGLVSNLANFASVDQYGFLITPYRKVEQLKDGRARVTDQVVYLDALEDDQAVIAMAGTEVDQDGYLVGPRVSVRGVGGEAEELDISEVEYIDISTRQVIGVPASLIPFVEHNLPMRALMGSNMQKQTVPSVRPDSPIVGTGMESKVAKDSGYVIFAEEDGKVLSATADNLIVEYKDRQVSYPLINFLRSNQKIAIHQRVKVDAGQKVKKGEVLVDSLATDNGELALGQNVLVAYMSYHGLGFEDAIIISDRLMQSDKYTSVHIEEYKVDLRDTKLGPEVLTSDIPNVSEDSLRNLDIEGLIRIGSEVKPGDILVGKITPKGEADLSAEEKLLRAIFGEKARDVRDSSLRLPHGEYGKVVDVQVFKGKDIPREASGVLARIHVYIAQLRKISVGDKMAGRHGNKGVISRIVPVEDMPYLEDGTPVDIILNPLGVVSRMNIGQILEIHMGLAAEALGYKVATESFNGIPVETIKSELKRAGLPEDGKLQLTDGRTGQKFEERTVVGYKYMLKLIHMVDDKIHARSTGKYAKVTQQPLGGKAMGGGQRFGEMEVWALEAHGAANTLQEMLTIKSDDVIGRSKAYESIVKGMTITGPRIPESFNVLVRELQSLALNVEVDYIDPDTGITASGQPADDDDDDDDSADVSINDQGVDLYQEEEVIVEVEELDPLVQDQDSIESNLSQGGKDD